MRNTWLNMLEEAKFLFDTWLNMLEEAKFFFALKFNKSSRNR